MRKVKSWLLIVIITCLTFTLTGCASPPNIQPSDGKEQIKDISEFGEITDNVELQKLWQEYISDTIATIGNTWKFDSPEEIDPTGVAQYCWQKYLNEHDPDNLERVKNSNNDVYFPLTLALEYAERYFNLQDLDVSKVPDYYYDQEKQAFTFHSGRPKRAESHYKEYRPEGTNMTEVSRNSDGIITVIIEKYNDSLNTRVEYTNTYTLQQREDGSLYFISGIRKYINNHLVVVEGDYQAFDKIQGFEGRMEELSMLGEADGKIILSNTPYNNEQKPSLILLNPVSMAIEKEVEIDESFESSEVKSNNEKVMVRLKYKVLIFSTDLELLQEVDLPKIITEKIDRDPQFDNHMVPTITFGGYDISDDLNQIVYADEIGVKLVNLEDNSEKLLSKTVPLSNSKLMDKSYHWKPRFVAEDKKVLTTMSGYEGIMGFTLCDLEENKEKRLDIMAEGIYTGDIRHDTGLLAINIYVRADSQEGDYRTFYLDFASGELKEIDLDKSRDTGFIRPSDYSYMGEKYGAFVTSKETRNDYTQRMDYLNLLNLETLELKQDILSIKATSLHILGVLSDGRIIFWYDFNPSEKGLGITAIPN